MKFPLSRNVQDLRDVNAASQSFGCVVSKDLAAFIFRVSISS